MDSLLEKEFEPAFTAWKASPNPGTSSTLLSAVRPVIDSAITSYGGSSIGSPTFRSRARLSALNAFQSYDPARGTLRTHLLSQMQGLRRQSAQEQNIISIPEAVALNRKHLDEAENNLRDELGRDPSDAELADRTGMSFGRLAQLRKFNLPIAEGTTQVEDAEGDIYEPASQALKQTDQAWENFVYADLGNTDRAVMDHLLGRNGRRKMTVSGIATKLGVTPGAVSQRAAKIQALLDMRQSLSIL
jgi:DNA-directed RNA polymerase specialized sigma subunit